MYDPKPKEPHAKSFHAEREEHILAFWKEKGIFEKSLEKDSPLGEFVFYEGPPTANGHPGIHHLEARAFKDAIPRYKTMRGFHVRRKGGWDTHGLPVELAVEKELGLKSKKEIESYGIAAFNDKCKESVWKYVHEWEAFTDRMGYWVDLKDPYITYKPEYIEAVWGIIKETDKHGLLYKDYKVVPWCPRCGTGLSSHELAQGYEDVKDLAVTVKFKLRSGQKIGDFVTDDKTFILAWTTTPWTLPGNVALAVGKDIDYVEVEIKTAGEHLILAKERLAVLKENEYTTIKTFKGKDLVGMEYEPLYKFMPSNENAYKVYAADFVTTTDGTGIVHIAPMYGNDDFDLGTKVGLPKHHLVNEDGTFKKETGFLAGRFVKEKDDKGEATLDIDIVKDLANRPTGSLLFAKEKYQHSYPFCWRCHTPLIYFARDSWYIKMSALRDKLVKENEDINWEPEHIKEGRFGEWLREVKDWAISRERYWGTPLPVWSCEKCHARKVAGSVADVSRKPRNTYYVMRHGEAEFNVKHALNSDPAVANHLTAKGKEDVKNSALSLKSKKFDLIIASPLMRTRETAEIFAEQSGLDKTKIITDDRIREMDMGALEGKSTKTEDVFPLEQRFEASPVGLENYQHIKKRVGGFIYDIESRYQGKTILIVTHGSPAMMLRAVAKGLDRDCAIELEMEDYIQKAEIRKLDFTIMPHNEEYELDLHRPFIDEVRLTCECGGEMVRAKEVMDVWFDSGGMPFAQDHRLEKGDKREEIGGVASEKKQGFLSKLFHAKQKLAYPADFISEAIDQTRGWFYTLHAIGILMGKGKAYKNVVCLGHLLDAEGKKMSKHIGNVVDPWVMMDKYGADALRFWMYSVNQPGDSKNFDEKTVDEVVKKVFNLTLNVLSFYEMYDDKKNQEPRTKNQTNSKFQILNSKFDPQHVLDKWIMSRLNQLVEQVTTGLDAYKFFEPTRSIRDFTADLSQWYLRRSRERFKGDDENDKQAALATTRFVLTEFSKILAPFTPFLAEEIYSRVDGELESVHLEKWPEVNSKSKTQNSKLIEDMEMVRNISSKGLEARMTAKINVRQPLAKLTVKAGKDSNKAGSKLSDDFVALIKDEVNVKEVVFNDSIANDVELDTTIGAELKEEGDLRELLRKIQDLRKEKGLSVGDSAVLIATNDLKPLVGKYESQIKKSTGLSGIEYGEGLGLR